MLEVRLDSVQKECERILTDEPFVESVLNNWLKGQTYVKIGQINISKYQVSEVSCQTNQSILTKNSQDASSQTYVEAPKKIKFNTLKI